MKITFLGGADEIGASAILIEVEDYRILVDAGIRLNRPSQHALPEFSLIGGGDLNAIILTHAHLDHSGALPVLSEKFPNTPIYVTHATASLIKVLLLDAVRIMESKTELEGEIPLYDVKSVENMLSKVVPLNLEEPVNIGKDSQFTMQLVSAGHILGAASVLLKTPHGDVFITGDISAIDQRTVMRATVPKIKPHLLICEATYGGKIHASRDLEEKRLIEMIAETLQNGGKVLIPAFAVGRAQEIILILKSGILKKLLPEDAKIYIDGLIRHVCDTYCNYPQWLAPYLRKLLHRRFPIFDEPNGPVFRVEDPSVRKKLVESPDPIVIIASSGMLAGGTSPFYARMLAEEPKNAIAITGYQDEESPGRGLLALAEKGGGNLPIPGYGIVNVRAKVQKYNLSAHADTEQLIALVKTLKPKNVIFVHGSQECREELSKRLYGILWEEQIFLPQKGDTFEKNFYRTTTTVKKQRQKAEEKTVGFGFNKELNRDGLIQLGEYLVSKVNPKRLFSTYELAFLWYGHEPSEEELKEFGQVLSDSAWPFVPDIRMPFKFRINPAFFKNGEAVMPEKVALSEIDKLLPYETGLYDKSVNRDKRQIILHFNFPDVSSQKYKEVIEELKRLTRWDVVVHPYPNKVAIEMKINELLPPGWEIRKNPSLYLDQKKVAITLAEESPYDEKIAEQIREEYLRQTGYEIVIQRDQTQKQVQKKEIGEIEKKLQKIERSDMATAFQIIDLAFKGKPFAPTKKSLKVDQDGNEYIELSFITPVIKERYLEILDGLEKIIGIPIKCKKSYNLIELQKEIQRLLPSGWTMRGNISLYQDKNMIKIEIGNHPPDEQVHEFCQKIENIFGIKIEVETK